MFYFGANEAENTSCIYPNCHMRQRILLCLGVQESLLMLTGLIGVYYFEFLFCKGKSTDNIPPPPPTYYISLALLVRGALSGPGVYGAWDIRQGDIYTLPFAFFLDHESNC
ncbi:hypothetical protein M426DRAFT_81664 [Hypoxylon sp. CI-4A]|nr:hypothetical protein M426DRAFT_81664 [Hypoxylon sp. CI-4A]